MKQIVLSIVLSVLLMVTFTCTVCAADAITCWYPPSWKTHREKAQVIARVLTQKAGMQVKPRIARNYPEILRAFASEEPALVYAGSFVQTVISVRSLGTPLVQGINGREFYSGVMVYPRGQKPDDILKNNADRIAFTKGASSGESSAKAATGGKASFAVASHKAAAAAVAAGNASAALVKNWWWEDNRQHFPKLDLYQVPGVSVPKNPDNVLTASKAVTAKQAQKITAAAIAGAEAFGVQTMTPFNPDSLRFSIMLMKKGGIDPFTYQW